jgi:hypothetical protein
MEDSLVNMETGEIDWESIKKLYVQTTREKQSDTKKLYCKKCNKIFYSKNYMGEFPLCDQHRNNTFKK